MPSLSLGFGIHSTFSKPLPFVLLLKFWALKIENSSIKPLAEAIEAKKILGLIVGA